MPALTEIEAPRVFVTLYSSFVESELPMVTPFLTMKEQETPSPELQVCLFATSCCLPADGCPSGDKISCLQSAPSKSGFSSRLVCSF